MEFVKEANWSQLLGETVTIDRDAAVSGNVYFVSVEHSGKSLVLEHYEENSKGEFHFRLFDRNWFSKTGEKMEILKIENDVYGVFENGEQWLLQKGE